MIKMVGSLEAAEILGVKRVTVNRWAASGQLITAHQGPGKTSSRLFVRADVEKLARARHLRSTTPTKVGGYRRRGHAGQGQTSIPVDPAVGDKLKSA